MSNILSVEKFCSTKILSVEILSDKVATWLAENDVVISDMHQSQDIIPYVVNTDI